jgi:hypothetical protein
MAALGAERFFPGRLPAASSKAHLKTPRALPTPAHTSLLGATETTDPRGFVARTEVDEAGRVVKTIGNYAPGQTGSQYNQTVKFLFDGAGRLAAIIALNPSTGDQATRFAYGTVPKGDPLANDDVARNDLSRAMIYPDSDDAAVPL